MLLPKTRKALTGYGLPSRMACSSVGICAAGRSAPSPPSILKRSPPSRFAFACGVRFSIRLGKRPRPCMPNTQPPGTSILPVSAGIIEIARMVWMQLGVCSIAQPQSSSAGLVSANRRAAALILSAATQVIGSAHSGGKARDVVGQRVETVGPALDERRVVELLADDDVEHARAPARRPCRAGAAATGRRAARVRSGAGRPR